MSSFTVGSKAQVLEAQTAAAAIEITAALKGRQPKCALHPCGEASAQCSDRLLHHSDYHSSRQLESFTHIATGPQTQAPSNRPLTNHISYVEK